MRALWTAASGMTAQQLSVDIISNNLSNVNTTAFKKDRLEFKDLLYETMDRASILNGQGKPINLQVGHGTMPIASYKNFSKGSFEKTEGNLDFAINGDAFFVVKGPTGQNVYTRDGSFKTGITEDGYILTTSEGYPVLDSEGNEIVFSIDTSKLNVSSDGSMSYEDADKNIVDLGQKIGMVKFSNREGLLSIGDNFYASTSASGEPVADTEAGEQSILTQGFLESSNVQVVEEMVKLIVAQRAYEVNSKAIQTSDEMLSQANNLKR
jgi:fagellar hook-basal body proteins